MPSNKTIGWSSLIIEKFVNSSYPLTMKQLLWAYSIFSLIGANSYAQHLAITNYSPQDGAPDMGANSVMQDNNGWIWMTTGHGVVRYDGNHFKSYSPATGASIDYSF